MNPSIRMAFARKVGWFPVPSDRPFCNLEEPALIGMLRSTTVRQAEHFEFTYAESWLQSAHALNLDPALGLYSGEHF